MRKISKTRSLNLDRNAMDADLRNTRPLRIPGSTITPWSESLGVDLEVFFAQPVPDATVAGAAPLATDQAGDPVPQPPLAERPLDDRVKAGTVSLSDGTRITFATAAEFDTVGSV
jgi:hypothetical protein